MLTRSPTVMAARSVPAHSGTSSATLWSSPASSPRSIAMPTSVPVYDLAIDQDRLRVVASVPAK